MTPQELKLVTELFDRLETLEGARRDPDAERAIAAGFDRAPNSAYALVQTVLVQDEALKRANARIEELEAALAGEPQQQESGGFLDSMRGAILGRDNARGSVPSVRPGGAGSSGVWNTGRRPDSDYGARADSGYGAPASAAPGFGGGSFLGTAAAGVAGVIGGAMLFNGIRSMFGGEHGASASSALDSGAAGGGKTPWGGDASNSDLARDAGVGDISGNRSASSGDGDRHAGLFGGNDDADLAGDSDDEADDDFDGGDFDDGGSDTA
jgi:hypothetical protein